MALYRVVVKLAFILVVNIIYMIFSFIYFCTHESNKDVGLYQIQRLFLIHLYEAIYLNTVSQLVPDSIAAILRIQQLLTFIFISVMVFYCAHSVYCLEKERKSRENKCWICLSTREQIEAKGQNYETHLTHEHRFKDYLYFFIEFDRKKRLDGI